MSDDELDSLKPMEVIGNSYFRNSLFTKEEKVVHYGKRLAIGRKQKTGAIYYLDLTEAFRGTLVGPTRSGKTWLLRVIGDRWKQLGLDLVYVTDVKNEFISSRDPVQEKFRSLLIEGEKPQGMKILALRPTFFKTIDHDGCPKKNIYYSVNLGAMSKQDFLTLMNAEAMTPIQQNVMELIYEKLEKQSRKTGQFSFDDIDNIINEIDELNASQKIAMIFKFRPLKASEFYVREFDKDLIKLIQEGFVPTFNMEGFENFGRGTFAYPEVFIAIVLRILINARRKKQIKEVLLMIDESPRFMPIERNPSSKQVLLESADVDTRYGVDYLYAAQDLFKVPESIVKQSRYIFLPANCDIGTIRAALMMAGLVRNQQAATNDAIYLKNRMSAKRHEWLVIDKTMNTKDIISPLAPLSYHLQSGE